jgi:hypothetical protein
LVKPQVESFFALVKTHKEEVALQQKQVKALLLYQSGKISKNIPYKRLRTTGQQRNGICNPRILHRETQLAYDRYNRRSIIQRHYIQHCRNGKSQQPEAL